MKIWKQKYVATQTYCESIYCCNSISYNNIVNLVGFTYFIQNYYNRTSNSNLKMHTNSSWLHGLAKLKVCTIITSCGHQFNSVVFLYRVKSQKNHVTGRILMDLSVYLQYSLSDSKRNLSPPLKMLKKLSVLCVVYNTFFSVWKDVWICWPPSWAFQKSYGNQKCTLHAT